jgi:CBS domain-containing protein/anti-sigma regulatory factor (Ser/Thr protein kinase)
MTADITRAEALAYELCVKKVMTRDIVTVTPDDKMALLFDLFQEQQISGAPVVAAGKLVGIVSVKDLVNALQQDNANASIGDYMSACPHTVRADDLLVKALEVFSQTRVGHLPVVDDGGGLAGILTKGDVANGLLRALQSERTEEEIRQYRASHLFEDIVSDRTSLILRYRVQPRDFDSGGMASAYVRQALRRLGASLEVARRTAIAVYEAEMNLVIHTTDGGILRVEAAIRAHDPCLSCSTHVVGKMPICAQLCDGTGHVVDTLRRDGSKTRPRLRLWQPLPPRRWHRTGGGEQGAGAAGASTAGSVG